MSRKERREEKKKNRKLKAKLGFAVIVLLCLAYVATCAVVPKDTIAQGLTMNGIDLSGLNRKQAGKKLTQEYEKKYANATLTIKALEQEYKIPIYPSLSFKDADAAEEAFHFAHSNFLVNGFEMLKAMTIGQKMTYCPVISHESALDGALETAGLTTLNTTTQTKYELTKEELQITMGQTGYSVDMDTLKKSISDAVAADDYETVIEAPMLEGKVEPLDVDAMYKDLHAVKREATLDPKNDYKIIRSVTGIDFDKEDAKKRVEAAKEGDLLHVEIVKDPPKINTDNLKKHLFEAALGSCITDVSGSNDRVHNVALAAKTINGMILMPGDEFSYNDAVGQRTESRGYKKAPAYSDGKTIQELGGGVCQVSSTLYKAVVLANLQVDEHHNHTYVSSYIGLGMDATVSWDGPDFRFSNNTDYPIKIIADYEDGTLTCRIRGAKLDSNQVIFSSEILKETPYKTTYKDDKTLEKGKTKVLESGHNGYVVQTYRTIVDKDGNKISSKEEDKCTYSKKDEVVARGTKVVKKAAPATQAKPGNTTPATGGTSTPAASAQASGQ